jgi:hypothetical protein
MYKAKVENIERIAWDCEKVTLKGADFKITIELSNPEDHGAYVKGEEVTISVDTE